MFQDGSNGEPAGQRREHAVAEARRGRALSATIGATAFHGHIDCPGFGRRLNPRWSAPRVDRRTGSRRSTSDRDAPPAPIRFPPDNFKHSLTLFSKSFSSFPRGTCSLSVSRPYLALDEIYRPIWAAFPNNPTRRQRLVVRQGPSTTGLSPSPAPPSRGLGPGPPLRTLLQTTIRTPGATDSHGGLFPVRSPLLGESLLVSFPPLIDMLKLSGWPRLTWGRVRVWACRALAPRHDALTPWPRALVAHSSTVVRGGRHVGPLFRQAGRRGSREAIIRRAPGEGRWRRCVTPRQTCPRPNGVGRNLRSKTRWFTGFCNSHQVSHFATFFIDARAEISVAGSRFGCKCHRTRRWVTGAVPGPSSGALASLLFLGACGAGIGCWGRGWASASAQAAPAARGGGRLVGPPPGASANRFAGHSCCGASTMILPQVHLRKPCYDFSFL